MITLMLLIAALIMVIYTNIRCRILEGMVKDAVDVNKNNYIFMYCLTHIQNEAVEKEDYETAEQCRVLLAELEEAYKENNELR